MTSVRHHRAEELIDLARGLTHPHGAPIGAHLSAGCKSCESQLLWFQRVAEAASRDAAYALPDHLVRNVRALFAINRPPALPKLTAVVARLVFDSFRSPVLAGVRSHRLLTRQALFEAGDYCLDLRVEREPGSRQAAIVGQIANRVHPENRMASLPVVLISGGMIVNTASNEFGEFQISYEPRTPLKLYVRDDGREIEVHLNRLHE